MNETRVGSIRAAKDLVIEEIDAMQEKIRRLTRRVEVLNKVIVVVATDQNSRSLEPQTIGMVKDALLLMRQDRKETTP